MKRRIEILVLVLAALMLVGAIALSVNDVTAGGNGYCSTVRLVLGGCKPPVTCDIGRPIVNEDGNGGYYLECYYDPQAPVTGGPLTLLEPGQRIKLGCPEPVTIYAIPDGESWLVVGCHD